MGAVDLPYTRLRDMSLVVDGYNGNVHLNPQPEILCALSRHRRAGCGVQPGSRVPARPALRHPDAQR
jgi:signal transduction protein with GAF and PtsI domain